MHVLNVHLDESVHNLTHYGCDPHSIASLERRRLRLDAEERRVAGSLRLTLGLMTAAALVCLLLVWAALFRA